jgi:hypothetical protein
MAFLNLDLFYKIENNMVPTYLSDCLPTTIGETVTYNLRHNDDYRTQRCRLQTSSKSFFPSTIRAILFSILSNKLSFLDFRRSSNFDHPVSKYKLSALE